MTILMTALYDLGYILIFPGFLFCFLVGMLLCGIDRKLVARMQKRVGPPILQPMYDFFKLCGKETIVPAAASKTTFMAAPLIGLAALVVIQLFIPVFGFTAFSGVADIIVILYLLLIPAMSSMLGGAASVVGVAVVALIPSLPGAFDDLTAVSTLIMMIFGVLNTSASLVKRAVAWGRAQK